MIEYKEGEYYKRLQQELLDCFVAIDEVRKRLVVVDRSIENALVSEYGGCPLCQNPHYPHCGTEEYEQRRRKRYLK
jgi:hypothetical protein